MFEERRQDSEAAEALDAPGCSVLLVATLLAVLLVVQELGLPVNPAAPLLGFIGRLDMQKGVDMIADNYEWLMSEGAQLVMLGSGRPDLEGALRRVPAAHKAVTAAVWL